MQMSWLADRFYIQLRHRKTNKTYQSNQVTNEMHFVKLNDENWLREMVICSHVNGVNGSPNFRAFVPCSCSISTLECLFIPTFQNDKCKQTARQTDKPFVQFLDSHLSVVSDAEIAVNFHMNTRSICMTALPTVSLIIITNG